MSTADLGARLGTSKQAVSQMEHSEADGSIRLATLRRAAEALNCRLVYALVPNEPLEEVVDRRAHELAVKELGRVEQTMLLEDQAVARGDDDWLVKELADELKSSRRLWRS
jgi:predicted DNA-binding mobile mystery protein A